MVKNVFCSFTKFREFKNQYTEANDRGRGKNKGVHTWICIHTYRGPSKTHGSGPTSPVRRVRFAMIVHIYSCSYAICLFRPSPKQQQGLHNVTYMYIYIACETYISMHVIYNICIYMVGASLVYMYTHEAVVVEATKSLHVRLQFCLVGCIF